MSRPPALSHVDKTRVVLGVLAREKTLAAAAAEAGVSAQAVANWRRQFVESGSQGLRTRTAAETTHTLAQLRVKQLAREVEELKIALAEAHLLLHAGRRRAAPRGLTA